MRNLTTLTNEQIEAAFDELGFGVNLDPEYGVDVVFTQDTIADFVAASASYAECSKPRFETTEEGLAALVLEGAQAKKGEQRRDVVVIDLGAVRAVYR